MANYYWVPLEEPDGYIHLRQNFEGDTPPFSRMVKCGKLREFPSPYHRTWEFPEIFTSIRPTHKLCPNCLEWLLSQGHPQAFEYLCREALRG